MQRRWWFLAVVVLCFFVIFVLVKKRPTLMMRIICTADPTTDMALTLQRITEERNKLSRQHNLLQQRHQQLVCLTKNRSQVETSETGGYCDKAVDEHLTDEPLARALADLFADRTVVGLGDGRGEYRKLIQSTRKVRTYHAYDGAPNIDSITIGQVKFLDLTLPQYWLPRYDWVLCLEVLEHIPAEFETIVLDNIVRAARHGVVLSWALPDQGGLQHINPRPPAYVKQTMFNSGFKKDVNASLVLRKKAFYSWFRQNINVYIRQ